MVDPLVGAINAGDPNRLSLRAVTPQLAEAAAGGGRVAVTLRARRAAADPEAPAFLAPESGMERLVEALEAKLASRRPHRVTSIERAAGGHRRLAGVGEPRGRVQQPGPRRRCRPGATRAGSRRPPGRRRAAASRLLAGIEYAPVVVVTLAFARSDVTISLDASGFLVPEPPASSSRRAPGPRPNGGSRRDRSSSGHPPAGMATIGRWSSPTTTWWTSSWAT